METHSSFSSLNVIRNLKRKKWTVKEKKIILAILQKDGHQNLQKFLVSLPHRTEQEVRNFLNKFKMSAEKKLEQQHCENIDQTLTAIHPWMPFINNYCTSEFHVHENLAAFTLPIMEHYLKHPSSVQCENVNFKWAYKALFSSLLGQKFPENMNHESFSMIFASLTQLFDDVRTEQIDCRDVLSKTVKRCLQKKKSCLQKKKSNDSKVYLPYRKNVTQLPEINLLKFTPRNIDQICKK